MNSAESVQADTGLIVRDLGVQPYLPVWLAMREFTDTRTAHIPDELWLLSHPPIFTQGQAGKTEHLLDIGAIPVVQIDRGGQVTYHGPGQLVVYLLLDVRRLQLGARGLVSLIEQALIDCLSRFDIVAKTRAKAPGVYVNDAKIAALGLRIRKGCCYHGLSLNVDMDLTPFARINPCGYEGLQVTQIRDHLSQVANRVSTMQLLQDVSEKLLDALLQHLGYANIQYTQSMRKR